MFVWRADVFLLHSIDEAKCIYLCCYVARAAYMRATFHAYHGNLNMTDHTYVIHDIVYAEERMHGQSYVHVTIIIDRGLLECYVHTYHPPTPIVGRDLI